MDLKNAGFKHKSKNVFGGSSNSAHNDSAGNIQFTIKDKKQQHLRSLNSGILLNASLINQLSKQLLIIFVNPLIDYLIIPALHEMINSEINR